MQADDEKEKTNRRRKSQPIENKNEWQALSWLINYIMPPIAQNYYCSNLNGSVSKIERSTNVMKTRDKFSNCVYAQIVNEMTGKKKGRPLYHRSISVTIFDPANKQYAIISRVL